MAEGQIKWKLHEFGQCPTLPDHSSPSSASWHPVFLDNFEGNWLVLVINFLTQALETLQIKVFGSLFKGYPALSVMAPSGDVRHYNELDGVAPLVADSLR